MTLTNLEKYVYSKKCLKQRHQPLPLPLAKSKVRSLRRYFRAENVTWLRLLLYNYWMRLSMIS